jgi:hypothetical protein
MALGRFAEGQWRPDGSGCEWMDISIDPAEVAAKLAAAAPASTVKAGGSAAAAASGAASGGATANGAVVKGEELVVGDSEGEDDPDEELRQAAAAVRRLSAAAQESGAVGQVCSQLVARAGFWYCPDKACYGLVGWLPFSSSSSTGGMRLMAPVSKQLLAHQEPFRLLAPCYMCPDVVPPGCLR